MAKRYNKPSKEKEPESKGEIEFLKKHSKNIL